MHNNTQIIFQVLKEILGSQQDLLNKISPELYTTKIFVLGNSTIGSHTRHIIEFFEIVLQGYSENSINYDRRQRNESFENNPFLAFARISELLQNLQLPNKTLTMQQDLGGENFEISTTYFRELLYNIEHCIHHQALIKVAISELNLDPLVDQNFGVAPSTINYRDKINHN